MKNKSRNIIIFINMLILFTSCAQFAPKANYQVETCDTFYRWDDNRMQHIITHETCVTSTAESNRESKNIVLKSNQKTGQLDFTAGELSNASETEWSKALARLLSDPNFLSSMAGAVLNAVSNNRNND